jgi:hypothetical protein
MALRSADDTKDTNESRKNARLRGVKPPSGARRTPAEKAEHAARRKQEKGEKQKEKEGKREEEKRKKKEKREEEKEKKEREEKEKKAVLWTTGNGVNQGGCAFHDWVRLLLAQTGRG